jgi:hypothetical protein
MWRRYDFSYPAAVLFVLSVEAAVIFGDLRWLIGTALLLIIAALVLIKGKT